MQDETIGIRRMAKLPVWFLVGLHLVLRRRNEVVRFEAEKLLAELDGLRQVIPEGRNAVERWVVDSLKDWVLCEKIRVLRMRAAGVQVIGRLEE